MKAIDSYPVAFRRSGTPLSEAEVQACADELELNFPPSYAKFLSEHNGGSPSPAFLPYPGGGMKVKRFFSTVDGELAQRCQKQRRDFGLPKPYLSIAELAEAGSFVVLDCSAETGGVLLTWCDVEEGFRYHDPEFSNAQDLYFDIDGLFSKFGPAKNREDIDGMFCTLYYAASLANRGSKVAAELVEAGYDINFVLPTFRHPIFAAIDAEVFGVAETLLKLGTLPTHCDPLHDDASVPDRLTAALHDWQNMLEVTQENAYPTGIKMAKRHLTSLEAAVALL